jgi:hypothetical protein
MKKMLLLLLPLTLFLTSCDLFNNFGKKYKPNDKNEVYYKGDGINETDAKKLADYLLKSGYFSPDKGATVQLTKENDTYHVRFVYDKAVFDKNKDQIALVFWFLQDQLAETVFNGKKVGISLADEKLKDFETIEEVNKVVVAGSNKVYFKGAGVKEKDAKFIGDSLVTAKFFDYTTGDLLLTKEKSHYAIRFIPNDALQKEKASDFGIILENYKYIISKYILNGDDVDLVVMDAELNEVKEIKDPSDQRKILIDQAITGQTGQEQSEYYQDQNEIPVNNTDDDQ